MLSFRTFQTPQEYIDTVVETISRLEDHLDKVTDLKDGKSTIGYGYTFERNNKAIRRNNQRALRRI
ncbi:hypothetical protein MTYM_01011 [Methylococcales bacterium]|nr:hypothetical protein MTYM_01011 [Methylococcales bacterium]